MDARDDTDGGGKKMSYASPQLRIFGNLAAVTSNVGGIVGKNDGGGGKDKTGIP